MPKNAESSYESNSSWSHRCARLIFVGLAVEIAAAFILHKSFLEGTFTISSAVAIWLGVWGELHFAKRAKEAGDEIVAEANARAAEANERAAKLEKEAADARGRVADIERITAWRRLSDEQLEVISTSLGPIAADADVLVEFERSDPEASLYSVQFLTVLAKARIKKLRRIGNTFLPNAVLGMHIAASNPLNGSFISDVFTRAHVPVTLAQRDLSTHLSRSEVPPNLYIFVGSKPILAEAEWGAFNAARNATAQTSHPLGESNI